MSATVNTSGFFGCNRLHDVCDPLEGVCSLLELISHLLDLDHGDNIRPTIEHLRKQGTIERIGEVLDLVDPDPVVLELLQGPKPPDGLGRHTGSSDLAPSDTQLMQST